MTCSTMECANKLLAYAVLLGILLAAASAHAQLHPAWTLTANGQPVTANPDGSFTISNIAAADSFPRDFLSDDFIRVSGTAVIDGKTFYAVSKCFQIRQGEAFVIRPGDLTFSDTPIATAIQSIRAVPDMPVLTTIGQTTPINVTATLPDGSTSPLDLTLGACGATYRTGNPNSPTPDRLGEGGSGTPGDGIADDQRWVTAAGTEHGQTLIAGGNNHA